MRVLSLNCNHCGAPLEVPHKTRFLTCAYCSTRLEVHRTGSAAYTETLESIDDRTRKIADDVAALKLHSELEEIDRQWDARRAALLIRDKRGNAHVPTRGGTLIGSFLVAGFGVLWTVMALAITRNSPFPLVGVVFPLFGVLFVVGAIFAGVSALGKAETYQRERAAYDGRRRALLRQLESRQREAPIEGAEGGR